MTGTLRSRKSAARTASPAIAGRRGIGPAISACITLSAFALATSAPCRAQSTERAVTLVVPYAAAGGADVVGRFIADKLREPMRQPVIVENRPGAGGQVGMAAVSRAAPDGYTIGLASPAITGSAFVSKAWTLDPLKDLTAIAMPVEAPLFVLTNSQVPANSFREFVAYAKSNPGKLNIGTTGGSQDLDIGLMNALSGMSIASIPYKGLFSH